MCSPARRSAFPSERRACDMPWHSQVLGSWGRCGICPAGRQILGRFGCRRRWGRLISVNASQQTLSATFGDHDGSQLQGFSNALTRVLSRTISGDMLNNLRIDGMDAAALTARAPSIAVDRHPGRCEPAINRAQSYSLGSADHSASAGHRPEMTALATVCAVADNSGPPPNATCWVTQTRGLATPVLVAQPGEHAAHVDRQGRYRLAGEAGSHMCQPGLQRLSAMVAQHCRGRPSAACWAALIGLRPPRWCTSRTRSWVTGVS